VEAVVGRAKGGPGGKGGFCGEDGERGKDVDNYVLHIMMLDLNLNI